MSLDAENHLPTGHAKEDIKLREKLIKDFYAQWIAKHPDKKVLNKFLGLYIHVKFLSINETYEKASRNHESTLAVFRLTEILENAVILYIWVTPEESRRKNNARANPDDPGSNLFHGVPMSVMLGDYGYDDMAYLREHTDKADTITVNAYGKTYYLPIGVFDNRIDKTSFLRGDKETWDETLVKEVTEAIQTATDTMWENYKK